MSIIPSHTLHTIYVSNNGYARVEEQQGFYAVQTYDTATLTYLHYKTFDSRRVAINIAEDISNV